MPVLPRLKTRAEFQAVMAAPVVARTAHFALHRLKHPALPRADGSANESGQPVQPALPPQIRIGAVTPKRLARRSVTRNALKRQIYTVAQMLPTPPAPASYVVRLRSEFARRQFPAASSTALKAAARAELGELWRQVLP